MLYLLSRPHNSVLAVIICVAIGPPFRTFRPTFVHNLSMPVRLYHTVISTVRVLEVWHILQLICTHSFHDKKIKYSKRMFTCRGIAGDCRELYNHKYLATQIPYSKGISVERSILGAWINAEMISNTYWIARKAIWNNDIAEKYSIDSSNVDCLFVMFISIQDNTHANSAHTNANPTEWNEHTAPN